MEKALRIKTKFWLINGSVSLTSAMEKTPLFVQSWARCNDIVVSWIINCVSPKIATSMVYRKTVKEVWKKLQDRFLSHCLEKTWSEASSKPPWQFCDTPC